ncbi:MAG: molybdenum cofactor biosynthesis protein MoaE [Pseudanabaenaceae cyanobacterium bins.68]|nr:molybdenum cofactor biosynthesis protein MoaE [Pseudanabaenaceae cyanobacterium bins.68]
MQNLLTYAPLELSEIYRQVDHPANGAIVVFSGMVRNHSQGRSVAYLDYQAYEPMALKIFEEIGQQVQQLFPQVQPFAIHHRLGKLAIGEVSVLIAVGSPHRQAAFAACEYMIDTLKQQAPIWKKEYWQNGDSSWV